MKNILDRPANLGAAPLYPTSWDLQLAIRDSNLHGDQPAVSVHPDPAHIEVVLFDPKGQGDEEIVLHRGQRFNTGDFDHKKSSSPE